MKTEENNLKVKIFADGADIAEITRLSADPVIKGFTTNPTLMRAAGITNYETFAMEVLSTIPDLPVSLEVFADDIDTMISQGFLIGSWGPNVNVKIPVINTQGVFTGPAIAELSKAGVHVNITAVFTLEQVRAIYDCLDPLATAYVSIFAGRIADSGIDPVPLVSEAVRMFKTHPMVEIIWASPRELYNIFHADQSGCHIITVTQAILDKLSFIGRDQTQYSLETSKMFHDDALQAGYKI